MASTKDKRLRRVYKTTEAQQKKQIESQGGGCEICGRPFYPNKDINGKSFTAYQDHSHKCCPRSLKEFCGLCNRGLLCFICNKYVVGILEKKKVDIDKLVAYVKKWERILKERGAYAQKEKRPPKLRKK